MASTGLTHDVIVPQWAWEDAPSVLSPSGDGAPLPLPCLLGSIRQDHTAEADDVAVAKSCCQEPHTKCQSSVARSKEIVRITHSKKMKRPAGTHSPSDSLLRLELSKERERCADLVKQRDELQERCATVAHSPSDSLLRLELNKERERCADLVKQRDELQERCATVTTEVENLRERLQTLEMEAQASGQLSARGIAAARAHVDQTRRKDREETTVKEMCSLRERINQQVHRELVFDWHALSLAGELERCAETPTVPETSDSLGIRSPTSASSALSSDSGIAMFSDSGCQSASTMPLTQTPAQFTTVLLEMLSDERGMRDALQLQANGMQATMRNVATELRNLILRAHAKEKEAAMNSCQPSPLIGALPDAPQDV